MTLAAPRATLEDLACPTTNQIAASIVAATAIAITLAMTCKGQTPASTAWPVSAVFHLAEENQRACVWSITAGTAIAAMGTAGDTPREGGIQAEGTHLEAIEVKAPEMRTTTGSTGIDPIEVITTTRLHVDIPVAILTGPAGQARCMWRRDLYMTCIVRETRNVAVRGTREAASRTLRITRTATSPRTSIHPVVTTLLEDHQKI
mmetsp:Transcript_45144/g.82523  ORF Transcript_45144/g.82523 Transcript_45144/m.82523 type:complete len:204 (+) Transcript_45144:362-973(+)